MLPPNQSRWLYLQHGTNSPHTLAAFVQVSPVSFTWIIQTASCFPPLCPRQPELSYKNIHHIMSLFYSKFSKGFPFLSKEEPASPEQPTRSCSDHAQNFLGLVFDSSPFTLPYPQPLHLCLPITPVQTHFKACVLLVSPSGNAPPPDILMTRLPPPCSSCLNSAFLKELPLTSL